MSFKDTVTDLHAGVTEAAANARGLVNKHLADCLQEAAGWLLTASRHPDLERVGDDADDTARRESEAVANTQDGQPLNSGGNALFAAGDPGARLANEEAARRAAFAAGAVPDATNPVPPVPGFDPNAQFPTPPQAPFPSGGVAPGTEAPTPPQAPFPGKDPEAKQPGDPAFAQVNDDFRDPNAVNLNKDGTLKTAPHSLGKTDERDGGEKSE